MDFVSQIRDYVTQQQEEIARGPITPTVTASEIQAYLLSRFDFSEPVDLNSAVCDIEQMMRRWQVQVTHPRYFGLFNPSVTVASVVADVLVAMYNPQLASWRTSPAANEIEKYTLGWFKRKFGLPENAAATFTSGGAESNLSAVIVGLTHQFPDYDNKGLRGLNAAPVFYAATEAHHSFVKIAHMTGLGRQALRHVPTDEHLRIDIQALGNLVTEDRRAGRKPFMVIGTAGTTGAGVIDPLRMLVQYCQSEDLWCHVDAAWGGAAAISPILRPALDGIEEADSITCDAHKWLSVPMGAGMFFCRHASSVHKTFRAATSYMPGTAGDSADDPYTSTVQWSRRFIGLKLFLSLVNNGERGYTQMIERQVRLGQRLRESLQSSGWEIVNQTPLPVVCFTRNGLDVSRFVATLLNQQIAWMSSVRLNGAPPVVRACITSFRTSESDIDWVVQQMNRIVRELG
jgi:glutamate/tyrosine decarboxylase-like PLP-dependent enzyme